MDGCDETHASSSNNSSTKSTMHIRVLYSKRSCAIICLRLVVSWSFGDKGAAATVKRQLWKKIQCLVIVPSHFFSSTFNVLMGLNLPFGLLSSRVPQRLRSLKPSRPSSFNASNIIDMIQPTKRKWNRHSPIFVSTIFGWVRAQEINAISFGRRD